MAKLKIKMSGHYLGIRFLSSTIVAAGADSFIFTLISFYGTMNNTNLFSLSLTMWLIKVLIEILGLPISIRLAKKLKKAEQLDIYDQETDFNLFTLDANYLQKDNKFDQKAFV